MERGRSRSGGREGGLHHRDPGRFEGGPGRIERALGDRGEALGRQEVRKHRRPLDRGGADLDHRVPRPEAARRHRPLLHHPEHLPDDKGLAHRARYLRVAADEHRAYLVEGAPHPREEGLRIVRRRPFGQQHASEEPSRPRPGHRYIVRVDDDRVRADAGASQGDGVRRRDQGSRRHLDRARVLAHPRSEPYLGGEAGLDEPFEKIGRELAGRQPAGRGSAFLPRDVARAVRIASVRNPLTHPRMVSRAFPGRPKRRFLLPGIEVGVEISGSGGSPDVDCTVPFRPRLRAVRDGAPADGG